MVTGAEVVGAVITTKQNNRKITTTSRAKSANVLKFRPYYIIV